MSGEYGSKSEQWVPWRDSWSRGETRSKVSLCILFWLRLGEGNQETQENGHVGSKWVHPQRHMPLSLGKGNTGLLGRAGLCWGRGMETATCHLERRQSDQEKQRQVDVDELGTIPNLRGG